MKLIKAIGLAGVAAMVAMAFVGVGTASATGLCSAEPETLGSGETQCVAGTAYTTGQEYKATATNAVLKNSVENVTCTTSSTTLKQTQANTGTGSALLGEVTALTFGPTCKSSGGFTCTVESLNKPYSASLSSATSVLTITAKSGEPSASVSCAGGLLSCVFGNTTFSLPVTSGEPGSVSASEVALKMTKKEGFLKCPESSKWTATYVMTAPVSVWVSDK